MISRKSRNKRLNNTTEYEGDNNENSNRFTYAPNQYKVF